MMPAQKLGKQSFFQAAFSTSIILILFKLLGFIKQAVVAYFFGTSAALDCYLVGNGFIDGVYYSVIDALGIAALSIYTQVRVSKSREQVNRVFSAVFEAVLLLCILLSLLIALFSKQLAFLLAPSFGSVQRSLLRRMICSLTPFLIISSLIRMHCSILDSEGQYTVSRLDSLFKSLFAILCIWLFSNLCSTFSLIIGDYLSVFLYFLVLLYFSRNYFHFRFVNPKKYPEIRQLFTLALPLMLGAGMIRINEMIDRILAAYLGEGNVSALTYSHVLTQFVTYLVIINVGSILFAHFSNFVAEGNIKELSSTLNRTLGVLVILLIPISVITAFCAQDIVRIVYYRGNFNEYALIHTSRALIGYAVAFPVLAVRDILTRSMYAFQNTRAPMINGAVSILLNILLSILLSLKFGIVGIALGTSISAVITMILNMRSFHATLPEFSYRDLLRTCIQSLPGIFICCLLLWFVSTQGWNSVLSFLVSSFLCFSVFCTSLFLMGNQNIRFAFQLIKSLLCGRT